MKTKNKTLVLDKVVEFDHFKYMRTKNKTLVLGGGYMGLSEGVRQRAYNRTDENPEREHRLSICCADL